jgi:hypothetical protein
MKRSRLHHLFLCGCLLGAFPVAAGPLRIVVLSETRIQSDTIFFSQLLPATATLELRAQGWKLNLGNAPAIGFCRRIGREVLNAALLSSNFHLEEFVVPESVTVRREGRSLTQQDVWHAIQARLPSGGSGPMREIRPDEVEMAAPTLSMASDPALFVTEMTYDRLLHSARFRLSSRTNPKIPPFYAWVSAMNDDPQGELHAASQAASFGPGAIITRGRATGVVLVEPSRMASLYLHSSNLSTMVRVRPLQPGQRDEIIRVRMPKNGKTLRARVVETDLVEAVF